MTTIHVAGDEVGAWEKTLDAAGDLVQFHRDCDRVRVTNVDGSAAIYFTVDGTAVVVGAQNTHWLPAVRGASKSVPVPNAGETGVKLDSSGTPVYSVEGSLLSGPLSEQDVGPSAAVADANGQDVDVVRLPVYTAPDSGELVGVTAATQLPDIPCRMAMLKTPHDNPGRVYVGPSGVTKADDATDTTTGFPLSAGEATAWLPIDNLNRLYRICDSTSDALIWFILT